MNNKLVIKISLILSLLLSTSFISLAREVKLTDKAEISILTCSPGPELHEIFGHSAIRIHDDQNNIDWVFNYGMFNYRTPNFYGKFLKGNLLYHIGGTTYESFVYSYQYSKRSIYEQKLDLDSICKQQIFNAIIENNKEENKYYNYDFQLDNCATRIRDIIEKNCPYEITYSFPNQDKSARDILKEYLKPIRWTDWGINTVLGKRLDIKSETRDYMYIPDYLMYLFDSASINGHKIVTEKKTVYQAPQTIFATPWYLGPEVAFTLIAILILTYSIYCMKRKIVSRWLDYIIFSIAGLVGILIFYMCFFSNYYSTAWNFNLLFFTPTHLLALLFLHKKENFWLRKYFWLSLVAVLHAIGLFYIIPFAGQELPWASLPLVLVIGLRSYMISKNK